MRWLERWQLMPREAPDIHLARALGGGVTVRTESEPDPDRVGWWRWRNSYVFAGRPCPLMYSEAATRRHPAPFAVAGRSNDRAKAEHDRLRSARLMTAEVAARVAADDYRRALRLSEDCA